MAAVPAKYDRFRQETQDGGIHVVRSDARLWLCSTLFGGTTPDSAANVPIMETFPRPKQKTTAFLWQAVCFYG
jgi:hypothetical protein